MTNNEQYGNMKMKRKYLLLVCMLLLCGCADGTDSHGDSDSHFTNASQVEEASSTIDDSSVPSRTYPQREAVSNEIAYYTDDEAKEIIQSNTHFLVAKDLQCAIPKNISHFSSFTVGYYPRQDNAGFYEDFLTMFDYLFPDETLYEDCLFYAGKNSSIRYDENGEMTNTIRTVAEEYDRIMRGEEHVLYYFYSPHFTAEQTSKAENNIFMEFTSPVCSDLSNFNKGVLADYYYESRGQENDAFLETWRGTYVYPTVCTLPPDSEEAYTLLDGVTISVADAVDFFENYINNAPIPENPTFSIKVIWVDVLQCDTDTYCYYFKTTKALDGIPFDWYPNAAYNGGLNYSYTLSFASMAVSDDIDQIYGMTRTQVIYDEVMHTEGISFATAMQKMEKNLSSLIDFEVISADFVYSPKAYKGESTAAEDYLQPTTASWKVSLYNPNDGLVYVCYVDALDGGNFRYYTYSVSSD